MDRKSSLLDIPVTKPTWTTGMSLLAFLLSALLSVFLTACAPTVPESSGPSSDIRFQFIYVIHGDAGYTFYDKAGQRRLADLEAMAQAKEVAKNSLSAEVFIFHQKPSRRLWFFRGDDGVMFHYRAGALVRKVGYRKEGREDDLVSEATLFRQFSSYPSLPTCTGEPVTAATPVGPRKFFLYFGHEIPMTGEMPYSRSRPEMKLSLATFARGLSKFGGANCPDQKPFSLVVLSSCNGGTPTANVELSPYTPYFLASPGELHLTYLDTRALARLSQESPQPFKPEHALAWGKVIAEESITRLRQTTSTAITISVYETDKTIPYLKARSHVWQAGNKSASGDANQASAPTRPRPLAYRDCGENPAFASGQDETGVTVFFQPAKFGVDKRKTSHSGWDCPSP